MRLSLHFVRLYSWGVFLGAVMLARSAAADEKACVDYLHLTRENLPAVQELITASFKQLEFDDSTADEWIARNKRSYLLPYAVSVGYRIEPDYLGDDFGEYNSYNNYDNGTDTTYGYSNGSFPGTYSDRETITAELRWRPGMIFGTSEEQLYVVREKIYEEDQKNYAVGEIAKQYGLLVKYLPENPRQKISTSQALAISKCAGILDGLSGFLISDRLTEDAEEQERLRVLNNDADAREAALNAAFEAEGKPKVTELIDAGLDDDVERIGGE